VNEIKGLVKEIREVERFWGRTSRNADATIRLVSRCLSRQGRSYSCMLYQRLSAKKIRRDAPLTQPRRVLRGHLAILAVFGCIVLVPANDARASENAACVVGRDADSAGSCPEATILWQGGDVSQPDSDLPDWARKAYAVSIPAFPDLQSCIAPLGGPNLPVSEAMLRWDAFITRYDAEICFFRLFHALGSVDRVKAWLAKEKFSPVTTAAENDPSWKGRDPSTGASEILFTNWSRREKGALWGTPWQRITAPRRTRGGGLSIYFDDRRGLIGVYVYGNSQWN
jgi:hypothetical protein